MSWVVQKLHRTGPNKGKWRNVAEVATREEAEKVVDGQPNWRMWPRIVPTNSEPLKST